MKRMVWIGLFLTATLLVASCGPAEQEPPQDTEADQTQAKTDATDNSQPSGPKVASAVGKALLRSVTGGGEEEAPEAPRFKP